MHMNTDPTLDLGLEVDLEALRSYVLDAEVELRDLRRDLDDLDERIKFVAGRLNKLGHE